MNRDELIRALRTFICGALVRDRQYIVDLLDMGDAEELSTELVGPMLYELEHPGYYGLSDCPILPSHFEQILKEAEKLFASHIWNGGVSGTGYLRTQLDYVNGHPKVTGSLTVFLHTAPEPTDPLLRPRSQHLGYPE